MNSQHDVAVTDLIESWENSPYPTTKLSNYFEIYAELFRHLRGTKCTFIETGVLDGGSLFMWRDWLGHKARIIGIDLNPEALKWKEHGFEIYIGDQGDSAFWQTTLNNIGPFDVLLDDGGHQSFQQIVTAHEAIRFAENKCLVVIEDTVTNFMHDFSAHGDHSFLEFSKATTDNLCAKAVGLYPGRFPVVSNPESVDRFKNVYSVQFFASIVAFKLNPQSAPSPELLRNRPSTGTSDFRYEGVDSATVNWPDPFNKQTIRINGGRNI